MQTLRKKTSPLKYKNETTRFLGDGVSFKAKLIGILEVSEARGDRMCQEALSDLKMAIRAAGEHKQRIVINIAIDGLRLRDEKTGDSLYHHPVHKISFIAQDMTDSRAFGYIFGSPDIGHRFFGIKTDKAASQVVIAMRDLFQVVFALKKKEIELAKQHLDKGRFGTSPLFSDSTVSSKAALSTTKTSTGDSKPGSSTDNSKSGGTAVADLVDLELELNSLQQGLNQMERITPSDPFGDSFTSYTKPILPPPPSSGRERSSRTSETSSLFSPRTPHTASLDSRGDWSGSIFEEEKLAPEPTKDERHEIAKKEIMSQFDVFTELDPLELKNPPKKALNDLVQHQESFKSKGDFATDPFGDAPFDDPFAGSDPFDDFEGKTKIFNASPKPFAANFDKQSRLMQLHENPSLDVSSESECAPEPPPRPLPQAKPPPLPPKKQNDLSVKPPPRPPHVEESIYDYMDMYETAPNSLEHDPAPTPPLPVPARKSKFESDFVPERPRKFNVQSSEEDYLTPISLPDRLLPPPHKKKNLEKPSDLPPSSLEGLDITLSQLTLSGLNELANRLNLPTNQLSNMTLAQLTSFLSNFMKAPTLDNSEFKPDFAANFGDVRGETYDRYAVFRELINEEAKAEPEADANVNRPEDDKYAALREIVESEMKKTEDSNENVVSELIEYSAPLEKVPSPVKVVKSPVPSAVSEIVNSARLTSGSLSDVVSGSSPEVDNTASNSEKKAADAAGESWAIFDQSNALPEVVKEKQAVQSEEGVSPWSSDSKEFGNSSPPEWRQGNSGSDDYPRRRGRRDQEGWWDTSAEPEVQYHPANRRSTDSYEEEYYECYERPRRRKHVHGGQSGAGGHSSSSRDVSPWEEEPRRRAGWGRHPRFEKHRDRRLTDSWDDEDDYEYEEDHVSRFHRHAREYPTREHDWPEDRRPRRRREADRWCCPDSEHDRYPRRNPDWRYYNRESQESWEDDYSNEADDSPHFLTAKKNWKRPSSASEMGEKSLGENRRYRGGRRSRSRDSQLPEPNRVPHRTKHSNAEITLKSATLTGRKRVKDPPKTEESLTFPRKSRGRSLFENDFVPPEASPRLNFEAPAPKAKPRSPFEDDFSPDKPPEGSIREEEDSFSVKHTTNVRKKKFRLNGADNLKKSESVNIFAQESDPFDDDFFSEEQARGRDVSTRTTDLKWSDEFGDYDKK